MLLLLTRVLAAPLVLGSPESTVTFSVGSSLDTVDGRARELTGTFDPTTRSGTLTVAVPTLTTGLGPRDARLLATCLEAARFPTITFLLDHVEDLATSGAGDATLTGRLTIRDVTRSTEVPTHFSWEGTNLHLTGRVDLHWADFGVPDPSVLVATVTPTVTVAFDVVARPPAAASEAPR
jgi:polyisoprenoid-binding protein YceI